jgi:hypothetical protein
MSRTTPPALPPARAAAPGLDRIVVGPVRLLGVVVTACAVLDLAEHGRREALGLGPVTSPELLAWLLALPSGDLAGLPGDPFLPEGLVQPAGDGRAAARLLQPPLIVDDVVVAAAPGRELRAVQEASLFAGFTARWVAARDRVPVTAMLEAKLLGVGLVSPGAGVLLPAEPPVPRMLDEWAWLQAEKTYRRWLRERGQAPGPGTRARPAA